jgi:hypothetical protein
MEMIMESKCFLYIYIHTHSPESYNHSIERLEQHYYTCDGDPRKEFFGFFFKLAQYSRDFGRKTPLDKKNKKKKMKKHTFRKTTTHFINKIT